MSGTPSDIKTIIYVGNLKRFTGLDKHIFEGKIVIVFLPISCNICFGAQTNRLIEAVLLSTHNICFG